MKARLKRYDDGGHYTPGDCYALEVYTDGEWILYKPGYAASTEEPIDENGRINAGLLYHLEIMIEKGYEFVPDTDDAEDEKEDV